MPSRVSPIVRLRAELDELQDSCEDVSSVLDVVVRRGIQLTLQTILEEEVDEFLGRVRYARGGEAGYRNGHHAMTLKTPAGAIALERPKLRQTSEPFQSRLLGKRVSRTSAYEALIIAGYVRGLSTRDVELAFEEALGEGSSVSHATVSRVCTALKETFASWQKRDLSGLRLDYLYLDGTYFRMHASSARAEPLLCAWGITHEGKKVLVGLSVGSAESYEAWKVFLRDLVNRNLAAPLLGISDGAAGLIKAFEEVFDRSLRQRCLVHKLRNVLSAVSAEGQAEVKQAYWRIFDDIEVAPGESAVKVAKDRASTFQTAYATVYPTAVRMVMDDLESLTAFLHFPVEHWLRVRHTNLLERTFGESRRRVKVIGRLPGEESCVSLVWAVLDRGSTGWRGLRQTVAGLRLLDELRNRLLKQPPTGQTGEHHPETASAA